MLAETVGAASAGCLVLIGRRSEMFIRGGYKVRPQEVEGVLGRHPGVAQVAVVPRPDPVMGEVGVAMVVAANPGEAPSRGELRAFAAADLARHKLPEAVALVTELPLTAMQKLDRAALRAVLADRSTEVDLPGP
jgi:acyl-CoA synthetase (AMP-forming)/AMP-acid ligase II